MAGAHGRLPTAFACFNFFPRSVGLGPTDCRAGGAFGNAPSKLCHRQAIPSISSCSASLARQSAEKKPACSHSRNRLWIALALPKCSRGSAFHWQRVRNTYKIASNTSRGAFGLRPPPGLRAYFRLLSRIGRCGISGSTRSQNASETTCFAFVIASVSLA